MAYIPKHTHIAYRCPECGSLIYGLVAEVALRSGMLRLKCSCDNSALDITPAENNKYRISAPCLFCKQNHSFVVSDSIFFGKDLFLLNCPYAGMDIGYIGEKEKIDEAAEEGAKALSKLITDMGGEELRDIQPIDLDEEEILPDAGVYDVLRFLVKDLEADGAIDCPCHSGNYDLRYTPSGIEAYCPDCGATFAFNCQSPAATEEYLKLSSIYLK